MLNWILQLPHTELKRQKILRILRFKSSTQNSTSLNGYVSRMKPLQKHIFWLAGGNLHEVENSPFVGPLSARGYEVLYMVEAIDEYSILSLPEFDGKKFQNIAEEGFQSAFKYVLNI